MKDERAVKLVEFLQSEDYEAELTEHYSGRCMQGNTTTGVTSDIQPNTLMKMKDELEIADIEPGFRSDSMGKGFIYY